MMEMMLEVLIGMLVMEVKKVANEVTNMMAEFALMKVASPCRKISN